MMVSKVIISRHHKPDAIEEVQVADTVVIKVGKDCSFGECQKVLFGLCGFIFKQVIFESIFPYSDLNQYIISRLDPA